MTSLDVLYYSLAIGFLFFVGALWYVTFRIVDILQSIKETLDDVHKIVHDFQKLENSVKDTVMVGIVGRVVKIANMLRKK